MADSRRRTDSSVATALFQAGWSFEFFQAVRLLARLAPHRKAIGGRARSSDEFVRFRSLASMAFPASAIDLIEEPIDAPAQMTVTFFGLTGPQGVLPSYYTECVLAERTAKKEALADFLNLFNHRLLSLFYAAWQKHRPYVIFERALLESESARLEREHEHSAPPKIDSFTHNLLDLIGMGTEGLRGRLSMHDQSLLLYAGLISQRPHSASAIRGVLSDYFHIPVEIDQYVGAWYELVAADRCYLAPEGERNQLGVGAFLGDRVWDQQSQFRLRLGPLKRSIFNAFLPGSEAIRKLRELVRLLVGQAMAFQVQLVLLADEVLPISFDSDSSDASRLGWSSWLKTGPMLSDPGDAIFTYLT